MGDEQHEQEAHRCGGCQHRLSAGWYLCERCSERLGNNLLEIAERFGHLSALSGYQPGVYDKTNTSGKPGAKPPGRLDVMTLRDFRSGQSDPVTWRGADGKRHRESEHDTPSVLRAVLGWAETIADERGFEHRAWLAVRPADDRQPPPFTMADHDEMTGCVDYAAEHRARLTRTAERRRALRAANTPRHQLHDAVDWLNRQDDWIARWPYAGDLATQTKRLRNRLRSAMGEPNPKPSAWCIQFNQDETECKAAVFIPSAADAEAPSAVPVVRCTGPERHEYTRGELARLAVANQQSEREAS